MILCLASTHSGLKGLGKFNRDVYHVGTATVSKFRIIMDSRKECVECAASSKLRPGLVLLQLRLGALHASVVQLP